MGVELKPFSCFRKCWRDAAGKPRGDVSRTPSAASSSPSQIRFGWRRCQPAASWGSPAWRPLADPRTPLATPAGRRWTLQDSEVAMNSFKGSHSAESAADLEMIHFKYQEELRIASSCFSLLAIESGSFPCCVILRAFLTASIRDEGVCNH